MCICLFVYVCVLSILCERYLQHQQNLYHVFVDFLKGLSKVLSPSLMGSLEGIQHQPQPNQRHTTSTPTWSTPYNINANLINAIQHQHQPDQCHTTSTPTWPTPYNIYTNLTNAIQHQRQPDQCHTTSTPTWPTSYNINANLTNVIQHLYGKSNPTE